MICFGARNLGILILLWSVVKIITLRSIKLFLGWIVMMILMWGICGYQLQHHNQQRALSLTASNQFQLRVAADDFNLTDGFVSGKGQILNYHQTVQFGGKITTNQIKMIQEHPAVTWQFNVEAVVVPVEKATNFNQFDLAQYYQTQGITNTLKIKMINNIQRVESPGLINQLHQLRASGIEYADRLPHPLNLYFSSLVLGVMDRSLMNEIDGMKRLGLIHLFSISGFHVYFMIASLEWLLVRFKIKIETIQLLLLFLLPGYFIFAGSSVGLFRAVLTAEIRALSRLVNLKISALDLWSIVMILNLLWIPQSLMQFGCQLSYLLSWGLLFTQKFNFVKQTFLMNLLGIPVIIFHLYEWHSLSLVANWIILPLFSVFIMPLVIMGGALFFIMPFLSQLVAEILRILDLGVNWISTLPGNILFGQPPWWLSLILLLLTGILIDKITWRRGGLLLCTYLIGLLLIKFPLQGEISFFDVGQGDSFLVRSPLNRSITLIDTGGRLQFGNHSNQDNVRQFKANQTSINYLKSQGISRIDNLCISHQDADHCGDLPAFIRSMNIKRIYIPWGMQNNQTFMRRINVSETKSKLMIIPVRDGNQIESTELTVYHPMKPGKGENQDSMVLGGNVGGINWLFTGDLDRAGELEIVNKYPQLKVDVLKLGHHGSKTSSDPQFLDHLHPRVAIISAGRNNRYHHPNQETVNNINQRHIKIYNTQEDGMISYHYRGQQGYFETKMKGIH